MQHTINEIINLSLVNVVSDRVDELVKQTVGLVCWFLVNSSFSRLKLSQSGQDILQCFCSLAVRSLHSRNRRLLARLFYQPLEGVHAIALALDSGKQAIDLVIYVGELLVEQVLAFLLIPLVPAHLIQQTVHFGA